MIIYTSMYNSRMINIFIFVASFLGLSIPLSKFHTDYLFTLFILYLFVNLSAFPCLCSTVIFWSCLPVLILIIQYLYCQLHIVLLYFLILQFQVRGNCPDYLRTSFFGFIYIFVDTASVA